MAKRTRLRNPLTRLTLAPDLEQDVIDGIRITDANRPTAVCTCTCGKSWIGREQAIEAAAGHVALHKFSGLHTVTLTWTGTCSIVGRYRPPRDRGER